jgi:hypothetical protein
MGNHPLNGADDPFTAPFFLWPFNQQGKIFPDYLAQGAIFHWG